MYFQSINSVLHGLGWALLGEKGRNVYVARSNDPCVSFFENTLGISFVIERYPRMHYSCDITDAMVCHKNQYLPELGQ